MKARNLQISCNKNRAEELGCDVWDFFVVPHFYYELDIREATKPRIIEGGRGSGKTMLLRYFSYQSTFSPRRTAISADELKFIGLYWKADTQFARQMIGRGLGEEDWISAFNHHFAVTLSLEILKAISAVACSQCESFSEAGLSSLDFTSLKGYSDEIPSRFTELVKYLTSASRRFETWLNNPRTTPAPLFLPGRKFALAIVDEIRKQEQAFRDTVFSLYLDEYENLTQLQRRIVNTHIKHCEVPLIVHLAMKKGSLNDRSTLGDESIVAVSDYRVRDLDELLNSSGFKLFAAEVLFSRIGRSGAPSVPVDLRALNDPGKLGERRSAEYGSCVLDAADHLLPGLTEKQIAAEVWKDASFRTRVEREIDTSLRGTGCVPGEVWRDVPAEAVLVANALLRRGSLSPNEILKELDQLRKGEANRFTGRTNWIHNNLLGAILRLYGAVQRPCIVYAGFDTFILLAHGNLRHFLELCDRCLAQATEEDLANGIPWSTQAEAAVQASASFISEIRNFGQLGYTLRNLVLALGSLFALAHARPTLSEPEINHFSVKGGGSSDDGDGLLFAEAIKWSVLFEERETKVKEEGSAFMDADWVLNPIYAPYFKISYRKRRKLQLTIDEIRVMVRGAIDERRDLLRRYRQHWAIEQESESMPLFEFTREST